MPSPRTSETIGRSPAAPSSAVPSGCRGTAARAAPAAASPAGSTAGLSMRRSPETHYLTPPGPRSRSPGPPAADAAQALAAQDQRRKTTLQIAHPVHASIHPCRPSPTDIESRQLARWKDFFSSLLVPKNARRAKILYQRAFRDNAVEFPLYLLGTEGDVGRVIPMTIGNQSPGISEEQAEFDLTRAAIEALGRCCNER